MKCERIFAPQHLHLMCKSPQRVQQMQGVVPHFLQQLHSISLQYSLRPGQGSPILCHSFGPNIELSTEHHEHRISLFQISFNLSLHLQIFRSSQQCGHQVHNTSELPHLGQHVQHLLRPSHWILSHTLHRPNSSAFLSSSAACSSDVLIVKLHNY